MRSSGPVPPDRELRWTAVVGALVALTIVTLAPWRATPAAADATLGSLAFSRSRTVDNRPVDQASSFQPPVTEIWITFDYSGVEPGTRLSRIARYNGEDRIYGDLPCCAGTSGRYATAIRAAPGDLLPEGAWQVLFYVNGAQAQVGTFEIASGPGSDTTPKSTEGGNDNGGDGNGNGNDNS